MIEIKGLVKNYSTGQGVLHALNGVDLKVNEGEIFGIIGPSGAGKEYPDQVTEFTGDT